MMENMRIKKPTVEQTETALEAAKTLRVGEDASALGHVFLYQFNRNIRLEEVYKHISHYLRSGHDPQEHAKLLRAIEIAEKEEHPGEDGIAVFPDS